MKNGQTTLIPGKSGFPPRVELGADDRVVEVFVGRSGFALVFQTQAIVTMSS
jgi:hypothetical protein